MFSRKLSQIYLKAVVKPLAGSKGQKGGVLKEFEFRVEGKPVGKARPRFARMGDGVKTYTPKTTRDYERMIGEGFLSQGGTVFEHKYLSVRITAYFPIPKSTRKAERLLMETGYVPYDKKPDCDNLAKSVLDGLNGVAWIDDKQVVSLKVKKYYGVEAAVVVNIREVYIDDN